MRHIKLPFPFKGLNSAIALSNQPPLTSPAMLNVRPCDVAENRVRGGQRPGMDLAYQQNLGGENGTAVIAIGQVTIVEVS